MVTFINVTDLVIPILPVGFNTARHDDVLATTPQPAKLHRSYMLDGNQVAADHDREVDTIAVGGALYENPFKYRTDRS